MQCEPVTCSEGPMNSMYSMYCAIEGSARSSAMNWATSNGVLNLAATRLAYCVLDRFAIRYFETRESGNEESSTDGVCVFPCHEQERPL